MTHVTYAHFYIPIVTWRHHKTYFMLKIEQMFNHVQNIFNIIQPKPCECNLRVQGKSPSKTRDPWNGMAHLRQSETAHLRRKSERKKIKFFNETKKFSKKEIQPIVFLLWRSLKVIYSKSKVFGIKWTWKLILLVQTQSGVRIQFDLNWTWLSILDLHLALGL